MNGEVQIWIMRVDGLDPAVVAPWAALLDPSENARAARFVFARNQVEYTAAHALARLALSAAAGQPATAFRFEAGSHGKPTAWIGDAPAGVHFNLSHTEGMVAVAVAPFEVGLDVEPLGRRVDLAIADRYFCPEEIAWLNRLPRRRQGEGFLRLWTLKEAFIKATGLGLSQGLDSFWFEVFPPAIRFKPAIADDPECWCFEQRNIASMFLAAVGFKRRPGPVPRVTWWHGDPAALTTAAPAPFASLCKPLDPE